MKNLLNPGIEFTDPDTLQFCLPLSDKEFWYCEPNCYRSRSLPSELFMTRCVAIRRS